MSQHRKHRGYETQRLVATYLAEHGWPYAEPTGAGRTGTDITGTPGLDSEIKARRGLIITELMTQLAERRDTSLLPLGVIRPDGWGPARIADWPVVMRLEDAVWLLHEAGYGTPNAEED
jgi:hypothetical protein